MENSKGLPYESDTEIKKHWRKTQDRARKRELEIKEQLIEKLSELEEAKLEELVW